MTHIGKLALIGVAALFFNGCNKQYTLTPSYNETNKQLSIDGYTIKNVAISKSKGSATSQHIGHFVRKNKLYILKDTSDKLAYFTMYTLSRNGYITDIIEDQLIKEKQNSKCEVTKISNLRFFDCDYEFHINSNEYHTEGIKKLEVLTLSYKEYNNILDYFLEQAKNDKIEVNKYTIFEKNGSVEKSVLK